MYFFIALLSSTVPFLLQSAATQHNLKLLHHSLAQLQIKLPPTPHTPPSAPSTPSTSSSSSTPTQEDKKSFGAPVSSVQPSLRSAMEDLTNQLDTLFPTDELITTIENKKLELYNADGATDLKGSLRDDFINFDRLYGTRLELLKHRQLYNVNNEENKKALQTAWQAKLATTRQDSIQPKNPYELAVTNLANLKHIFTIVYASDVRNLPAQEKNQIQLALNTLNTMQKNWGQSALRQKFKELLNEIFN